LDLQQQLVLGATAHAAVDEHHLDTGALEFIDEYGLVGEIPAQAIRGVDIEAVQAASGRQVAQPLQGRPQQGGPAAAVVEETPLRRHDAAVGLGPLQQGGHLAGDAALQGLTATRHPGLQGDPQARCHSHERPPLDDWYPVHLRLTGY
jgi:hypothetical protein